MRRGIYLVEISASAEVGATEAHYQASEAPAEGTLDELLASLGCGATIEDLIAAVGRFPRRPAGAGRPGEPRRDQSARLPQPGAGFDRRESFRIAIRSTLRGFAHTLPSMTRSGVAGNAIQDGPVGFFGCVLGSDNFTPVRHGAKPRPHRATMGDYISPNMFEQLAEKNQVQRRPLPSRKPKLELRRVDPASFRNLLTKGN